MTPISRANRAVRDLATLPQRPNVLAAAAAPASSSGGGSATTSSWVGLVTGAVLTPGAWVVATPGGWQTITDTWTPTHSYHQTALVLESGTAPAALPTQAPAPSGLTGPWAVLFLGGWKTRTGTPGEGLFLVNGTFTAASFLTPADDALVIDLGIQVTTTLAWYHPQREVRRWHTVTTCDATGTASLDFTIPGGAL